MLQQFFRARGLSYFVMGFGYGEGGIFPEAIIRKYDLHPKWVIVNADQFFGLNESVAASEAVSLGYLGAWKTKFETVSSLAIQRRIHRIFPDFAVSQWDGHPQWIEYRAKGDGTSLPAAWRGTPEAVRPEGGACDSSKPGSGQGSGENQKRTGCARFAIRVDLDSAGLGNTARIWPRHFSFRWSPRRRRGWQRSMAPTWITKALSASLLLPLCTLFGRLWTSR